MSQTLEYLNSIPQGQDEDLVLIIDAYDVWFQLRPDVLIQRYYMVRDAANERLISELGSSVVSKHGLSQTIFFNADKVLWPHLDTTTDPWWLANSSLPEYAFGPETDKGLEWANRPRWLNSGAVMGPLGDMRRLFNATLSRIDQDFNETLFKDSDQLYFSKLYEDQEYARRLLRPNQSLINEHPQDVALLPVGMETEYHISLDYKSDLFLANAFYEDFWAYMTFDTPRKQPQDQVMLAPYQIDLPTEILSSLPPYNGIASARNVNKTRMDQLVDPGVTSNTWRNVGLGTNLITNQVFPLLHMTGHKEYLDELWNKMWYFPNSRALLRAADIAPSDSFITKTFSDGRTWRAAQKTPKSAQRTSDQKIGAWSDQGKWLPWDGSAGICEIYEDHLFGKQSLPPPESLDSDLQKKLDAISSDHPTFSSEEAPVAPPQEKAQEKHDASMNPPRRR